MTLSHHRSAAWARVGGLRVRFAGVLGGVVPGVGAGGFEVVGGCAGGGWGGCALPGGVAGDPPGAEPAALLGSGVPGDVLPVEADAEAEPDAEPDAAAEVEAAGPSPSGRSSTADRGGTLSPGRRSGPGATAPAAA
ncbi:hypothetical protein AB0M92_29115 [Streptomyces sp. NPDC051582]|uniref:hypothetical protein n=1 Tax=Streptomyces sp. NPDC051582 TaxID=3155167 RepID=UPI0034351428